MGTENEENDEEKNKLNEIEKENEEKNEEMEEEEEEDAMQEMMKIRKKKRRKSRHRVIKNMKKTNVKYLIFSACLLLVFFFLIPLIFVYSGSEEDANRGDANNGAKVSDKNPLKGSQDANNDDYEINIVSSNEIDQDKNSKETLTMTTPTIETLKSSFGMKKTACRDYYFPCQDSIDEKNETICINRLLHCNQKIDCPNGEDERHCDYIPIDIQQNFNFTKINLAKNSSFLQKYESNYHGNCSLFDLIQGKCVCHMDHKEKADCKNQGLTTIPDQFRRSITSINLEGNEITFIDTEAINSYVNLTIISLRYNLIDSIPSRAFVRLSKLTRLYLRGNRISSIPVDAFVGLTSLIYLYINENQIKVLELSMFTYTPQVKLLDLAQNQISFQSYQLFPHLERLDWLDLSENRLDYLSSNLFSNLRNLTKIHLNGNQISNLDKGSFAKNTRLTEINLAGNRISNFPTQLFKFNTQLRTLNLEDNVDVKRIPKKLFIPLKNLHSLNLTGMEISNVVEGMFESNRNLSHLYFSRFKYCLYAPHVRVCLPSSDGVSSLQHLLIHSLLRISVWFVAAITCFGNLTVITWRSFSTKEDEVLSLFVKNLSVADLLMGVYLVAIGIKDVSFADKYLESALGWMYSWKCSMIGILAMISSELSVLILTIVAIERYRSITFNSRLVTVTSARLLMAAAWTVSLLLALFPLIHDYTSRGEDDENSDSERLLIDDSVKSDQLNEGRSHSDDDRVTGYYGSNGLCFPLHIDDPFAPGWKYSAFIFLGVNFTAVISMLFLYSRMFMVLSRDRSTSRPGCIDVSKEDMVLAVRFFFIVLTDCLCWLPIVAIKFIAFTSYSIHPTIYAWVVVFILPINSAINPIIYTIAAPTSIRRIIHSKLRSLLIRIKCTRSKYCPCCPSNFDETRSIADSTTTYMSEMLSVNNNKKRASSDGSFTSMVFSTTPFLSVNGSRRTSYDYRRNSARSELARMDSGRSEFGRSEFGRSEFGRSEFGRSEFGRSEFTKSEYEKSGLGRMDSGSSRHGRRCSNTSTGSKRMFKFTECPGNELECVGSERGECVGSERGNGSFGRNGNLALSPRVRHTSFDLQSLDRDRSLETNEDAIISIPDATTQIKPLINVTSV